MGSGLGRHRRNIPSDRVKLSDPPFSTVTLRPAWHSQLASHTLATRHPGPLQALHKLDFLRNTDRGRFPSPLLVPYANSDDTCFAF